MGLTRYVLIELKPYGTGRNIFEVHEVKLADTTRPSAMLDVAMRMARSWSDRNHDVRFAVLPYWDSDADVCDQDTVAFHEQLVHTVTIAEESNAAPNVSPNVSPDVSKVVTSLLPPKPPTAPPALHEPPVKPIRVIRPHRQSRPAEGEGA